MNFRESPFSILLKEKREMDYIVGVYKSRVQAEIESFKDFHDKEKEDTIQVQDIMMLDSTSI